MSSFSRHPGNKHLAAFRSAALPALETLQIENSLPRLSAGDIKAAAGRAVISLPRLVSLKLKEPENVCFLLWTLLKIHPAASVNVCIDNEPDIPLAIAALSRHVCRPDAPTYVYIKVRHYGGRQLSLYLLKATDTKQNPGVEIYFRSPMPDRSVMGVLSAAPLQTLHTLDLESELSDLPFDDVVSFFTAFANLRCLCLSRTEIVQAYSSLLFPSSLIDDEVAEAKSVPLPGLEELHISGSVLTTPVTSTLGATQPLGLRLCRALELRKRAGFELPRLKVEDSPMRKKWVPAWKAVVREVHWHYRECYCAEGEYDPYDEDASDVEESTDGYEEEEHTDEDESVASVDEDEIADEDDIEDGSSGDD